MLLTADLYAENLALKQLVGRTEEEMAVLPTCSTNGSRRALICGPSDPAGNLSENAIRHACIGKKNGLFIGHPGDIIPPLTLSRPSSTR